jgi:hypothetical protein
MLPTAAKTAVKAMWRLALECIEVPAVVVIPNGA